MFSLFSLSPTSIYPPGSSHPHCGGNLPVSFIVSPSSKMSMLRLKVKLPSGHGVMSPHHCPQVTPGRRGPMSQELITPEVQRGPLPFSVLACVQYRIRSTHDHRADVLSICVLLCALLELMLLPEWGESIPGASSQCPG